MNLENLHLHRSCANFVSQASASLLLSFSRRQSACPDEASYLHAASCQLHAYIFSCNSSSSRISDWLQSARSCCLAGPGGNTANYSGDCYSNLFAVDETRRRTVSGQMGMWCPDVAFSRLKQNLSSVASTVCDLSTDPLMTSYYGCRCTHPLQPYYYIDSAGDLNDSF